MLNINSGTVLLLGAFVGAVHAFAPDHWMPTSLLAWRRRWDARRTAGFAAMALLGHVATGFLVYLMFFDFFRAFAGERFLYFAIAWVCAGGLLRLLRFPMIDEVFRSRAQSGWQLWAVLSLLGPCEWVIPVLMLADQTDVGRWAAGASFAAGTLISGVSLVFLGGLVWDRPALMGLWGGLIRRLARLEN